MNKNNFQSHTSKYIIYPPNTAHSNLMKFDEKPFIKNKWLVVGFVSVTLEREIKSRKHYMKYSKTWMVPKLILQWQYSDLDFSQHKQTIL